MDFRSIKEKSGMTQKEIAVYLNIPLPTIEAWCRGTRTPPEYVINLIEYKLKKEGIINE